MDPASTPNSCCRQLNEPPEVPESLLRDAALEIESFRRCRGRGGDAAATTVRRFPQACREILTHYIPGNGSCVDCGAPNPEWAGVSYGCLLCLHCTGRHRGYGVNTSYVKSLYMDGWDDPSQVVRMLEGGNAQLRNFFDRHRMGNGNCRSGNGVCNSGSSTTSANGMTSRRYLTKAAQYYRVNLADHAASTVNSGIPYAGPRRLRRRRGGCAGATANRSATGSSAKEEEEQRRQRSARPAGRRVGSRICRQQEQRHHQHHQAAIVAAAGAQ